MYLLTAVEINILLKVLNPNNNAELWLIHIGDFFKREASDFLLALIGTGIFNSTIQIGNFPAIFSSENKNCSQTNGCCTHSSKRLYMK